MIGSVFFLLCGFSHQVQLPLVLRSVEPLVQSDVLVDQLQASLEHLADVTGGQPTFVKQHHAPELIDVRLD